MQRNITCQLGVCVDTELKVYAERSRGHYVQILFMLNIRNKLEYWGAICCSTSRSDADPSHSIRQNSSR